MKTNTTSRTTLSTDTNSARPDGRWRSLMEQGNVAFGAGNMTEALASYLKGLIKAERLLRSAAAGTAPPGADPAPMVVVTASNAANVHMDLGEHAKAQEIMQRATTLLRLTINDDKAPAAVRMNCLQHINRALLDLIRHMKSANAEAEAIAHEVEAVKQAANHCLETMKTKHFQ